MKHVLAISGKRFAGKDTLARLIVEHAAAAGVTITTHAFADESKAMLVATRPGLDLARLKSDRAYKELHRPALTAFTVDVIASDPLVFCRRVADRIAGEAGPSIVTDMRLRLELDHLRTRYDLRVVRLVRSDRARAASGWTPDPAKDEHPTETELDDPALWNEIVDNDGSLDALAVRADAIAHQLVARVPA